MTPIPFAHRFPWLLWILVILHSRGRADAHVRLLSPTGNTPGSFAVCVCDARRRRSATPGSSPERAFSLTANAAGYDATLTSASGNVSSPESGFSAVPTVHVRHATVPQRAFLSDAVPRHRALLQDETDGASTRAVSQTAIPSDTDDQCALSPAQISELLDEEQRTWRVSDAALRTLDGDLQMIIDCTREDDTVLFRVKRPIKLSRRVEIPWRLVLGAPVDQASDAASAATELTVFRCRKDRGAFLLRSGGASFGSIVFTECYLNGTNGDAAIIDVEKCDGGSGSGRVVLERVVFRDNVLNGTSAVRVGSDACTAVEMSNVSFVGNACSGTCFADLSLENRLTNVTMQNNTALPSGSEARGALIAVPAASITDASGMVAVRNEMPVLRVTAGSLTLINGQFSNNVPGSVIVLTASIHASMFHCQFSGNGALDQSEGAIYANHTRLLSLTDCSFEGNAAIRGGALSASRSFVGVHHGVFRNNSARAGGGALSAENNSTILLEHSSIVRNRAVSERGGGIRCRASNVTLTRHVTLRHNEAGTDGGAISAEDLCQVLAANASIVDNRSQESGGGVSVRSGSTATLRHATLRGNRASFRGGAAFAEKATLTVLSSQFTKNRAVGGGSLALRLSFANVTSSDFEKDAAETAGGSISALWRCRLSLTDVSITSSRSKIGAGLYLSHSYLAAESLRVSRCNATESGGGLHGGFASAISCSACAFGGNTAGLLGGGVSLNATHPLRLSYNFTDSRFTKNRARRQGGALYFVRLHREDDDGRPSGTDGTRLFLFGSRVARNAAAVGGAFFVSHPRAVKYRCAGRVPKSRSGAEAAASGLRTLDNLQTSCPEWYDNSAETFGSFAASYARDVRPFVRYNRSDTFQPWNGTRLNVEDHRSGEALPGIRLTVVDGFGQGPAVGANETTVTAVMSSDDRFFAGSIRVALHGGEATIDDVIGFHHHGQHNISIDFSEETIPALKMVVAVRDCSFGESSEADGTFCSICSETQFSFDPRGKCRRCPDRGDCSSKTAIHPRPGYWHSCPCSQTIEECPVSEACDFEERKGQLAEITQGLDSCALDVTFLAQYRAAQCREGYKDALCGSCDATYGRTRSLECSECHGTHISIVLYVLSILLLLLLTSFAVRSNLTSSPLTENAVSFVSRRRMSRSQLEEQPPTRYVQLTRRPVGERAAGPSDAGDRRRAGSQARLHKQRMVEIFKVRIETSASTHSATVSVQIAVNFLQVIAVAVSINVDWTRWMITLFSAADFFGSAATAGATLPIDCFLSSSSSVPRSIMRTVFLMAIPAMVAAFFAVFWIIATCKSSETCRYFAKRLLLSHLLIVYIAYVAITKTAANTLFCVEVHEACADAESTVRYWMMDTSVRCYEGAHAVLVGTLGIPVLLLFSLGFPAILALFLTSRTPSGDIWLSDATGFLYRAYKEELVFWESLVMIRKSLLAVIVAAGFVLDSNVQSILAVCVLTLSLYLHTVFRPFRSDFDPLNNDETAALVVCQLTFAAGLLFHHGRIGHVLRILLTLFLTSVIVGLSLFFFFKMMITAGRYSRASLQSAGVDVPESWGSLQLLFEYAIMRLKEGCAQCSALLFPTGPHTQSRTTPQSRP